MANANLFNAKANKKDEFYTQLADIENELQYYKHHFENKIVLCNCDDPFESNFFLYFALNFKHLKLKKLISTCYQGSAISQEKGFSCGYKIEFYGTEDLDGDGIITKKDIQLYLKQNPPVALKGDGSYDSPECLELLKESDIVATNPPFSRFKEYVPLLIEYNKKFIIIGNQNAITCKEIFPLIKENKMWIGNGFKGNAGFFKSPYEDIATSSQHKNGLIRVSGVTWFSNLDIEKRHEKMDLYMEYKGNEDYFPKYDNYNAIEVSKTHEIPKDYDGIMGVPITFLNKYNPEQFEIVGLSSKANCYDVERLHDDKYYAGYTRGKVITRIESNMPLLDTNEKGGTLCRCEGRPDIYQLYWRIFIKRK